MIIIGKYNKMGIYLKNSFQKMISKFEIGGQNRNE